MFLPSTPLRLHLLTDASSPLPHRACHILRVASFYVPRGRRIGRLHHPRSIRPGLQIIQHRTQIFWTTREMVAARIRAETDILFI